MSLTALPPRLSLRGQQRQVTRNKLKTAARKLFVGGKYTVASVDMIAREAGVSRATFYLHFDGKFAILSALIDDDIAAQKLLYLRMASIGQPVEADIVGWLETYTRLHRRDRRVVSFLQMVVGLHPELATRFTGLRDDVIDILGLNHPAFRWRELDPELGAWQRIRAHLLIIEIEQLNFHLALDVWPLDRAQSYLLVARRLLNFTRPPNEAEPAAQMRAAEYAGGAAAWKED